MSPEILKQCPLNLDPELNVTKHHKQVKWHLSYRCHNNNYAARPVLIQTKIPRFNRIMSHFKLLQMRISGFHRKRLEPGVLPWQQDSRCHSVSLVMYISGATFEGHCFYTPGDILD